MAKGQLASALLQRTAAARTGTNSTTPPSVTRPAAHRKHPAQEPRPDPTLACSPILPPHPSDPKSPPRAFPLPYPFHNAPSSYTTHIILPPIPPPLPATLPPSCLVLIPCPDSRPRPAWCFSSPWEMEAKISCLEDDSAADEERA
ncbi:hypothetical protein E2C01_035478 [Portunus trituberculatus]|uniref:Uncharacterized protein n=1 Tax=Portunus trituberculatus TaxID=210409 RepID=A0A5B7F5Z3_PORTR|nr:hypothetical protein [Portunus trituberculatus]